VLLRHVAAAEGESQQALGRAMQIPPSRMVALVDELERAGLLERRPSPADRRAHALHLTGDGRRLLVRLMQVSAEHEAQLCAGLTQAERHRLIDLLSRIAAEQGLPTGVHPGVAANADDRPEPEQASPTWARIAWSYVDQIRIDGSGRRLHRSPEDRTTGERHAADPLSDAL
jgi:DNA-binding MarR family transcriptional regulator